jgi:hypothetical protein
MELVLVPIKGVYNSNLLPVNASSHILDVIQALEQKSKLGENEK